MKKQSGKILALNRKAKFDYLIEETFEAGISLLGWEVKSIKNGGANITDSYASFDNDGIILFGMDVSFYKFANQNSLKNIDTKRNKRLLMHSKEIVKIENKMKQKKATIIPLNLHLNSRNKIKVEIAIAVGKKLYDKRAAIKERDLKREARQRNFAE